MASTQPEAAAMPPAAAEQQQQAKLSPPEGAVEGVVGALGTAVQVRRAMLHSVCAPPRRRSRSLARPPTRLPSPHLPPPLPPFLAFRNAWSTCLALPSMPSASTSRYKGPEGGALRRRRTRATLGHRGL